MAYIYKTINKVNGKIYIGQTKRNLDSYLGSGTYIKEAIKEYGSSNFERFILEEVDELNINERERYWISYYNSTDPEIGYNRTHGGSGFSAFGIKRTDEFKQKISESKKGKPISDRQLKSLKELHKKMKGKDPWNKGKKTNIKLSDEHAEKLHASRRGKPSWNAGITGCYTRSDETKKKISDLHKDKPKSQEHKEKISKALKGKKSISLYDKWINKYGKEIADEKMKSYKEKQSLSKRKKI